MQKCFCETEYIHLQHHWIVLHVIDVLKIGSDIKETNVETPLVGLIMWSWSINRRNAGETIHLFLYDRINADVTWPLTIRWPFSGS